MTTKDILKIVANLVVIYLVGGAILSYVHANTSPIRYQNNIIAEEKALKLLIPDAEKIDKMGDWEIHENTANTGKLPRRRGHRLCRALVRQGLFQLH